MNQLKEQITLYKKRSIIHNTIQPLKFTAHARKYIKKNIKKYNKSILKLFFFVLTISSIEILIPLFLNRTLDVLSYDLNIQKMYWFAGIVLLVLVIYVYLAYQTIAHQKKLSLDIINQIREEWIHYYLTKKPLSLKDSDKGNIFVKVSYHLSLLQLGLNNSLFVFFQWLIFMGGILVVTALLDTRLFLISLAFIPINILVIFFAYLLSSYYLSQDQTLYSKILRFISDTFQSFDLVKSQGREKNIIQRLRSMVDIDNYFRIKREVTIRLGNHIIFAVLACISIGFYIISLYQPLLFSGTSLASLTQILIYGLHLKLIYLSLRMGLFYFPLKLGLYLCIPPKDKKIKSKKKKDIQSLTIKSRKVSLSLSEKKYQSYNFSFSRGKSYYVYYPLDFYNIAHLFAGMRTSYTQPWIVVLNKKRMSYDTFVEQAISITYIHSYRYSQESLFEYLEGNINHIILDKYEVFKNLTRNHPGSQLHEQNTNDINMVLIQIAHAILLKDNIIIIDAMIYDLSYSVIDRAIEALKKECTDSIIIICSHKENTHNHYDVTYNISS